jgi:hypothetical protein
MENSSIKQAVACKNNNGKASALAGFDCMKACVTRQGA